MPNLNGYDSTKAIRILEEKYSVPEKRRQFICGYSGHITL